MISLEQQEADRRRLTEKRLEVERRWKQEMQEAFLQNFFEENSKQPFAQKELEELIHHCHNYDLEKAKQLLTIELEKHEKINHANG